MNQFSQKAFSIINKNQTVFELTQTHGIHGVAVLNTDDPSIKDWFNPRLKHSLGIVDDDALSWAEWISPEDFEKMKNLIDRSRYSSEILSGEINFIHSKGFLIPMIYQALRVDQNLVIALKKVSDYANIKNNQKFSFEREQLLQTILDTIDIAIIACDRKGKLTLFNQAAKEWHGLPAENIPQTEYSKHYSLYEPDGSLYNLEDIPLISMLNEGVIRKSEMIINAKNGKERSVTVNGSRLYDERKNVNGAVVALYDITERKKAENQLLISENMFRNTFEHAADGMSIADAEGKFIAINESLSKMVGYSSDELKEMDFLEITHPDDIEDDIETWKELMNLEREHLRKEKRYIHKNGQEVPIILSVSVVKDANSKPVYTVGQMTDISELKSAEEEIARILRITEDQNQRLKNFAHIISHDLRSHATNLEMLLDIFATENPEVRENEIIKMAFMAFGQLSETLNDLNKVAFANLFDPKNTIQINLRNNIEETLTSINGLIKKADLKISVDISDELEVLSLPAHMESVILNFATNAIKYRSPDRKPILRFEAFETDQYVKLLIKDNGVGIDLEKVGDKLFGMYNTFHDNQDAKGIGLFLTKNQIEAIGGKVEVESQVDKGTTFKVYLRKGKGLVPAT